MGPCLRDPAYAGYDAIAGAVRSQEGGFGLGEPARRPQGRGAVHPRTMGGGSEEGVGGMRARREASPPPLTAPRADAGSTGQEAPGAAGRCLKA
jgi:hypothetical protein